MRCLLPSVCLSFGACCYSPADVEDASPHDGERLEWSFLARWENDTFAAQDHFYTNGAAIAVSHTGDSWADPIARWLPWGEGRRTVAYEIAHVTTTPVDISRVVPDPDDHPYAGLLWGGLSLHVDRADSYHGLKLIAGVVGPSSLAAETQRLIHEIINAEEPQGWAYQLEDEPILNLVYEHRRRLRLAGDARGWSIEALPLVGGMLGNMLTQVQVGGQVRAGFRVPDDFGTTLMRGMTLLPPPRRHDPDGPSSDLGVHLYGGATGNVVLRNIALDGNTFEDGPRVDKKYLVPAGEVGIGIGNRDFQATFSYVIWGEEFEGQEELSQFGALTFGWIF